MLTKSRGRFSPGDAMALRVCGPDFSVLSILLQHLIFSRESTDARRQAHGDEAGRWLVWRVRVGPCKIQVPKMSAEIVRMRRARFERPRTTERGLICGVPQLLRGLLESAQAKVCWCCFRVQGCTRAEWGSGSTASALV